MKLVTALLLVVVPAAFYGCSSSKKVSEPKVALMISDFDGRAGVDSGTAQVIRDAFASQLQKTGRFMIVDRKATAAIMQEQQFVASQQGEVAAGSKLKSLRKMLSGSVGKLGEDFVFNIKMTDMETATVDFAITKMYNGDLEDVVDDFLPQLVREVLQSMPKN